MWRRIHDSMLIVTTHKLAAQACCVCHAEADACWRYSTACLNCSQSSTACLLALDWTENDAICEHNRFYCGHPVRGPDMAACCPGDCARRGYDMSRAPCALAHLQLELSACMWLEDGSGAGHQLCWERVGMDEACARQPRLLESSMPSQRAIVACRFLPGDNAYHKSVLRHPNALMDVGGMMAISA